MKKKRTNEGVLKGTEKFVNAFFDGLKRGAADQIIKKAEKAKLPPDAIKTMKQIDDLYDNLEDLLDDI